MTAGQDQRRARPGAPPSRTAWITSEIRNAILHGEFAPGEQLRSATICARWSVSQTPIREAFQRLAAEGLVVHSSQRGVRVAPVSVQDLDQVYELRLLLEPMALRRSVERADEAWAAQIRRAHEELCGWDGEASSDLSGYERPHRRFHATMVSLCDSDWLLRVVHMLAQQSSRYWPVAWQARGGPPDPHDHDALLDACLRRDTDEVVRLSTLHLRVAVEAAMSRLAAPPTPRPPAADVTGRHAAKAVSPARPVRPAGRG
jgi:DNA-binding GntR family transcriptional regulator